MKRGGVISPEDIKSALNYTIEPSIVNGSVDISSANVKSLIDYDLKDWQMIWYLPDYFIKSRFAWYAVKIRYKSN